MPSSESIVAEAIEKTDWFQFAFLDLFVDDKNYLDGSGCLPDDGLSILLSVNGIQFVSEVAPDSPGDLLPFFAAYLKEDMDKLYGLIFDAENRGLTRYEIEDLRIQEVNRQS